MHACVCVLGSLYILPILHFPSLCVHTGACSCGVATLENCNVCRMLCGRIASHSQTVNIMKKPRSYTHIHNTLCALQLAASVT